MTNGTAVEKKAPATLKTMLEERRPEIKAMLPQHVNIERFMKSALLAVARDSNLQACTPLSLLTAVINAAELGLDFTPGKAHAYLVKYGDKAQFMPSYKGMIDLARRSGDVKKIEAFIVKENDLFKIKLGTNPGIEHEYPTKGSRGDMIGVYAVATFADGDSQFDYMTREEIDAIRKRSKAANSGPWVTDYNEMARKTVVRRLFKYLPCSSDMLTKAIEADNNAIGFADFEIQPLEDGDKTRNLAEKLAAKNQRQIEPEQVEVIDEETGEVTIDTPPPAPEPPKRGRPKKSESAGEFDPKLAGETIAELINTGKLKMAEYRSKVKELLDYPTDNVPPTQLSQDEATIVLTALGYSAQNEEE